ncbi:MAG: CBS domain-containing protein [Bacteroidales bacterium]|jgi:acetoin utilization protein AcuB|nr:CBS domain-containing protein [Bacteroidales bacterium]
MNVNRYMTKNPVVVTQNATLADARDLLKTNQIHRLPVVDQKGHLIGIVTEKDILYATPSSMTTLDVYEIHSLFAKLTIKDIMTNNVISINSDTHVEEAAKIMADNNIGGLTVVDNKMVVGIITESDLFKVFINMFGVREKGFRITMLLPEVKGELARLASAISNIGGEIISFANVPGDNVTNTLAVMKLKGLSEQKIREVIEPLSIEISEIHQV